MQEEEKNDAEENKAGQGRREIDVVRATDLSRRKNRGTLEGGHKTDGDDDGNEAAEELITR